DGQTTSAPPVTSGGSQILTGRDTNPVEVHGLFTALIRLKDAIGRGDNNAIQRGVALLDEAADRLTVARGDVGLRSQAIDVYQVQLSEQKVELEKARSNDLEVDLTEVISQLTARQASFEAALRAAGTISQLTLLNFL
ncbi:MAG: hypothetical protein JNM18_21085, partial [Planctomycetaceae bacterium]|nr:hypothetical protein [Planctomycetaceae bacterium]